MTWILLLAGLVLLIISADLLVRGAARLANSFGVPALVIGLTVVVFGTSAPELAVSVKSAWAGQAELAIANVVSSNIFNILCVLGLSGMISPEPLIAGTQFAMMDIPIMLAVSVLCLPLFFVGGTLNRFEGGLFLLLYLGYVGYMVAAVTQADYVSLLQASLLYGLIPFVVLYVVYVLGMNLYHRRKLSH